MDKQEKGRKNYLVLRFNIQKNCLAVSEEG
jgi:hypothetical protein